MHTTLKLIDAAKAALGDISDYELARTLELTRAAISAYRHRGVTFDDDTALRVAKILKLDGGYVLACMHGERAKRLDERRAWEALAKKAGTAAIVLISIGNLLMPIERIDGGPLDLTALADYTLCAIAALSYIAALVYTCWHFPRATRATCPGNRS